MSYPLLGSDRVTRTAGAAAGISGRVIFAAFLGREAQKCFRKNSDSPTGCYRYRHDNREKILKEISESLSRDGENSIYVASKIFGDSAKVCLDGFAKFQEFAKKLSSRW